MNLCVLLVAHQVNSSELNKYVDNSGNNEEQDNMKSMIKLSGHKGNLSREERVAAAEQAVESVLSVIEHKEIRTYWRYGTESVIVFDNPIAADAFFKDAAKKGQDHPVYEVDTLLKQIHGKATSKLARVFHEMYTKEDALNCPKIESDKGRGEIYFNTETVARIFINDEFEEPKITFNKRRCSELSIDAEALKAKFQQLIAHSRDRYS